MNFHILTLFPDMVMGGLGTSITGRAMESKTISVEAIDIRDYSKDKHRHVDDAPYGGGAGMVMQPGPVCEAYEALCGRIGRKPRLIYMTPQGRVFNQTIAEELAKEEDLVFSLRALRRNRRACPGADCHGLSFCGRLCPHRRGTSRHGYD